ncbi:hypothetical protein [Okeania sp.]|uniref:hypothetical protein n=1 Tax=Okeania sp. TaxID=3100323 RepID=UPI002B4B5C49|nr:hypothetical protein [Okeania sp.]MEB3339861.1 hypothetical protein [Okeania sp.]
MKINSASVLDLKIIEKKHKKRAEVNQQLRTLKSKKFACILDAETTIKKLFKNFLYQELAQTNVQEIESESES